MATLDCELKNGDMVQIILDKHRKSPNRNWLKFVKTSRAKEKIKQLTKTSSTFEQIKKMLPGMKK